MKTANEPPLALSWMKVQAGLGRQVEDPRQLMTRGKTKHGSGWNRIPAASTLLS